MHDCFLAYSSSVKEATSLSPQQAITETEPPDEQLSQEADPAAKPVADALLLLHCNNCLYVRTKVLDHVASR